MTHMSRAGRKNLTKIILRMAWRKNKQEGFTVGWIAKKMGMKSSTNLKNMVKEMIADNDEIILVGGDIFRVRYSPYVQTSFFERPVKIDGLEYFAAQEGFNQHVL